MQLDAKNWISLEVLLFFFFFFFFHMFSMKVAGGHTHSSQKKTPSPILSDRSPTVCFKTNPFHRRFVFCVNLLWKGTVARNCHIKYKILTSNTNYLHQIQITHVKYKILTSNTNYSHQKQITHIKYKLLSLVPSRSRLGQSWTLPWALTSPRDT